MTDATTRTQSRAQSIPAPATLIHLVLCADPARNRRALDRALALKPAALEVGMPFSDPCADNPALFAAGQKALDQGLTLKTLLEAVSALKPALTASSDGSATRPLPLILRLYANMAVAPHTTDIYTRAARAGFSGLVIADLPPVMLAMEKDWCAGAQKAGLKLGSEGFDEAAPELARPAFYVTENTTPAMPAMSVDTPVYCRRELICA